MNLNWFSPLPPAKTGIADFVQSVLPSLRQRARVTLWTDQIKWDRSIEQYAEVRSYQVEQIPWEQLNLADLNVYNLGNNHLFHGSIWQVARRQPGAVILHDFRLHEFFDSLYRNHWQDTEGYLAQMEAHYGEQGLREASAALEKGATSIQLIERYPLTALALENSLAVLVHTKEAFDELKQANRWLVAYAPLPFSTTLQPRTNGRSTRLHAPGHPYRLIVFGFINRNRRLDALLHALAQFPRKDRFVLDIYGEVWDLAHIRQRIQSLGLRRHVILRGFVSESDLDRALANADLAINLRYPTVGEASISQLRIWAHSLPTLVTRVGWYGSIPDEIVAHVRPDHEEQDIQEHLGAFLDAADRFAEMGKQGYRLLVEQHTVEQYVEALLNLATQAQQFRPCALAYKLAERVGISISAWADSLATDDPLRRVSEEILTLTSGAKPEKVT
ncbi:MAG TPA: glycosyltransferase [Pyrinomonadaceae bacterium]|nr:glycosyltransferase [Pyrinomonadaceae bacterium]